MEKKLFFFPETEIKLPRLQDIHISSMPHNHQFIWNEIGFYEAFFVVVAFVEITFALFRIAIILPAIPYMRYKISYTQKENHTERTAENRILPLELDGSVMMVAVLQFPEHK